jgi:hypothetical protein
MEQKKLNNTNHQTGFTLVEALISLVIFILLAGIVTGVYAYFRYTQLDLRTLAQGDLRVTRGVLASDQDLLLGAGVGLGYFNGFDYAAARRVGNNVGIVTPLKINGRDGVLILTSSPRHPRLEITASTTITGNTAVAKVVPSEVISLANTTVVSDLLPKNGDLCMLVGGPMVDPQKLTATTTTDINSIVSEARLVRVVALRPVVETVGIEQRTVQEITFDLCTSGQCSQQIPALVNTSAPINFEAGNTLVPLRSLVLFYRDGLLVENEGGTIAPSNTTFSVIGGKDISLTPIGDFQIAYELNDGSIRDSSTVIGNLDKVLAVQILPNFQARSLRTKASFKRETIRRLEIKPRVLEVLQ